MFIRKVTNEFALVCIDNRLRQMAIFTSLSKRGKDPLNSFPIKANNILNDLSLYDIKQVDSMLPCVCSVKHSAIAYRYSPTSFPGSLSSASFVVGKRDPGRGWSRDRL